MKQTGSTWSRLTKEQQKGVQLNIESIPLLEMVETAGKDNIIDVDFLAIYKTEEITFPADF